MKDAESRIVQDTINSLELEGAAARLVQITCEQIYTLGVTEGLKQGQEIMERAFLKKNKKGLSK